MRSQIMPQLDRVNGNPVNSENLRKRDDSAVILEIPYLHHRKSPNPARKNSTLHASPQALWRTLRTMEDFNRLNTLRPLPSHARNARIFTTPYSKRAMPNYALTQSAPQMRRTEKSRISIALVYGVGATKFT
jgi:hypothetical protein